MIFMEWDPYLSLPHKIDVVVIREIKCDFDHILAPNKERFFFFSVDRNDFANTYVCKNSAVSGPELIC